MLKLYSDKVQVLNFKDQSVRLTCKYEEILGLTKSLRIGTQNFILHFRDIADEEWVSTQRENVVVAIGERYKKSEGRTM